MSKVVVPVVRKAAPTSGRKFVNVPAAAWPWLVAGLAGKSGTTLVVPPEGTAPEALAASISALMPARQVMCFPAWDVMPYDRLSPAAAIQAQRLAVVSALVDPKGSPIVVAPVAALMVRVPREVAPQTLLKPGVVLPPATLAQRLTELGYVRVEQVHNVGEWAQRGGVIDLWPASEQPLRLEFFDDEIERLASFDPSSQRSMENVPSAVIGQTGDVVLTPARQEAFRAQYRELFETSDTAYGLVSEGQLPAHASQLLPLFWNEPLPLLSDMLPSGATVILPGEAKEQAVLWEETLAEAYQAREDSPGDDDDAIRAVPPERLAVVGPLLMQGLERYQPSVIHSLDDGDRDAERPKITEATLGILHRNHHASAQAAAAMVVAKIRDGWRVVLVAPSAAGLNQLLKSLEGEGAPAAALVNSLPTALAKKEGVAAAVAAINSGWADEEQKLLVLAEGDVFGARLGRAAPRRKRKNEDIIAHFSELRDGDYVVHEDHGIGRYAGLITMDIGGTKQDFLKVLYAGDDRLFVPVENLDVLSRYKGAESGVVSLDKLGGTSWGNRKAKVKADLMEMADDLLATAAARETTERVPLAGEGTVGSTLYTEFCAGFPYDLTEDQQQVMTEVEGDFAQHHPMDRLVVGDVGFGKTEVALRAAFLAAAAGKQVAVVCPTTLLARQHFDLFQTRFAGFPMKVGRLSRLVSASESKATKEALARGDMQIVVGTHALLSKDIKFSNLGLVIIDEEQRFGVAHKERLKQLRANVDILTLTATPIPRTLQMAVGGVRQLSLIATPPVDRQAVATFVLPWDNKTLGEAIRRELARAGQVYVVAPHIDDLPQLAESLETLIPNIRLGVAHGQMAEGELEDIMVGFYEGKIDVLLATTIIESGLDVPRANTLIVYRADRFGLAQLYQLRGRVGRSTRRAYAYFILPEGGLQGEAAKRLTILQRLTDLGAGFTLASYDMDLRGFGNLLGKQQSGHIRDIGFELYNKLLKEAIATKKARPVVASEGGSAEPLPPQTVTMKLGITYLIPDAYVPDAAARLQLYRRLANIHTADGLDDFKAEMADRYGAVPPEVEALLQVMQLRNRAQALNIGKLEVGAKGVVVAFHNGQFGNPAGLMQYIMKHVGIVSVRPDQSLVWHRNMGDDSLILQALGGILSALEKLVA